MEIRLLDARRFTNPLFQMFGSFDHGRYPSTSLIVDTHGSISALAAFWAGNFTDSCNCGASASPDGALMLDGWSMDQGVFGLGSNKAANAEEI
jgi:hypothetical protein